MKITEIKKKFISCLQNIYELRESENITSLVLEDILHLNKIHLFTQDEKNLTSLQEKKLISIQKRLLQHEPVQYVLGKADFYGLQFKVNPVVLIPRPETEELVDWVITDCKKNNKTSSRILDIGTGSGCIAIALKKNIPHSQVIAMDIIAKALVVAKKNARLNKTDLRFKKADILNYSTVTSLPSFHIIISNPPYITLTEKMKIKKNVLNYEPHQALFAKGNNPLIFYDAIADFALHHLTDDGNLYLEINESKGEKTTQLLQKKGLIVELKKDLNGKDRMIKCRKKIIFPKPEDVSPFLRKKKNLR